MIKKLPLHTFLLAVYFPIALFASNLGEINPLTIFRLIVFMMVVAAAILFLLNIILHDWRKTGLLASFIITFFSIYGLLHDFFKSSPSLNPLLGRHRVLLGIILVFFIILVYFINKKLSHITEATLFINLFTIYLIAMPLAQIGLYSYQINKAAIDSPQTIGQETRPSENTGDLPDIYYIILDAYDRQDYLLSEFGYDNSAFLGSLSEKGFYIAECSRSNYAHTFLSLSSTLNMDYIPGFLPQDTLTEFKLKDALVHSRFRENTAELGYQTVAFENVHWDFSDADTFYKFTIQPFLNPYLFPFESTFIDNSIIKTLNDMNPWLQEKISSLTASAVKDHYYLQKYIMDSLDDSISLASPKFIFGHIEKPHGPYVFEPNGDFIEEDAFYRDKYFSAINKHYSHLGYVKQIEYINQRMIHFVEQVLIESNGKAIIIIQGDHGIQEIEDLNARMAILYAVYLPDQDYSHFYPSITPVNTFRLIQDKFFSTDLGLIKDKSYYSYREDKLDYFSVKENMPDCVQE